MAFPRTAASILFSRFHTSGLCKVARRQLENRGTGRQGRGKQTDPAYWSALVSALGRDHLVTRWSIGMSDDSARLLGADCVAPRSR